MALLMENATIITMNSSREVLRDHSLVLHEDRILDLGPAEQMSQKYAEECTAKYNLKGKFVFPGFINVHTHAALCIARGMAEDMGLAPAYTKSIPQGDLLTEEECYLLSMLGAVEALRFGSTLITDNYIYSLSNVKAFAEVGLRAIVSERIHDANLFKLPSGIYDYDRKLGDSLIQKNIDLIEKWHGREDGKILCFLGPHAPDTCSPEILKDIRNLSAKYNVGLTIHLAQSKSEVNYIQKIYGKSPVEYLEECGILSRNLVAAHCIYVTEADREILARNQVNVAHMAEGNAKGGMIAPIQAMCDKKINVALGTDNMAANMIETMRFALCVGRILNESCTVPQPLDIVEMATINAAKALGLDRELGSVEVGKKADLVVIDYQKPHLTPCINPLGNLLHTGLGSDVEMVFVNGKLTVANGEVLTVDVNKLLSDVQSLAQRKWQEANPTLYKRLMN